jgi:hypothetical protein
MQQSEIRLAPEVAAAAEEIQRNWSARERRLRAETCLPVEPKADRPAYWLPPLVDGRGRGLGG